MSTKSVTLPFNPNILAWARKRRGLSLADVAHSLNIKIGRIIEWENGDRAPTVRQGRNLAHVYERPFLEFFARSQPQIPEVRLVPDFRFHRIPPSVNEERDLREVQQWAEEQRLNALALLGELGETPSKIHADLKFRVTDDVEYAATKVRSIIGFSIEDQLGLNSKTRDQLPQILRAIFESCGVLVLKRSDLSKLRTRGVCLYTETMPVIVYGNESASAQAFTLVHEFAHVLLSESGISDKPRFGSNVKSPSKAIENWCNRFAAAFLIPEHQLYKMESKPNIPAAQFSDDRLIELAKTFSISRHAMLIRLVNLGYVEASYYWYVKRREFIEEEESYKSFGRASYYGSRYVNSHGRFYTGLVLDAWESGRITSHNAAEYMGIKNLRHLQDIRQNFGGTLG